jgi:hypothetical protein
MGNTMPKTTPEDTDVIFLGSGALTYAWYFSVAQEREPGGPEGAWVLKFRDGAEDEAHPERGTEYRLTHADVMKAVRKITGKGGQAAAKVSDECARECRTLIFNGPEDVDFDADTADQVLQVAAFGEVVYG